MLQTAVILRLSLRRSAGWPGHPQFPSVLFRVLWLLPWTRRMRTSPSCDFLMPSCVKPIISHSFCLNQYEKRVSVGKTKYPILDPPWMNWVNIVYQSSDSQNVVKQLKLSLFLQFMFVQQIWSEKLHSSSKVTLLKSSFIHNVRDGKALPWSCLECEKLMKL